MFKDLKENMNMTQTDALKMYQMELTVMKNAISEMKNPLDEINSRLDTNEILFSDKKHVPSCAKQEKTWRNLKCTS